MQTVASRRREYGITDSEFARILVDQGGVCAVCGTDNWGSKSPHLDHCHNSGQVRGILCGPCNTGLGMFQDDPDLLRAAIKYLEARHDNDLAASPETVDVPELSP
jgi:hypothetical protein